MGTAIKVDGMTNESELVKLIINNNPTIEEGHLELWGHKGLLRISNIDTFHNVLQIFKVDSLKDRGDPYAEVRTEKISPRYWTICLNSRSLSKTFLEKYECNYTIED
jgi:hypothetical protein